ncbi:MAG TPA: ATP-binding protein [Povalibacter sp.]
MMRWRSPSSLTGRTLLRIALGVAAIIVASAATSYVLMFNEIERKAREELAAYVAHRVQLESEIFSLARDMQKSIVRLAIERYPKYQNAATLQRFDEIFERVSDGSIRVRSSTLTKDEPISGWLHRDTALDDELRQRMMLFYDLVGQFKPAAHVRFADIFFTAPEQLNIGTDPPGFSLWAMAVPADFDQNSEPWAMVASVAKNPKRETVWTGADLDPVWKKLFAVISTPIDRDGRHIGTIHNDLLIDTLVENLRRSGIAGAKHSLFQMDGRLIAHTDRMNDIVVSAGKLRIEDSNDRELFALWKIMQQAPVLPFVGHDEATDQYLAMGQIEGPGWFLAATLPGNVIRHKAFAAAQWVLWVGLVSLAVVLVLLTLVLNRTVARPLHALTAAVDRIASGDYRQTIRPATTDELARLAAAFNEMMLRIGERDAALVREKQELQNALQEVQRQQEALHQSEKLASMGSLLAGVAHELNNPLFVVSGRAQMLAEAAQGTPFEATANHIRNATDRCVRIVKTFLAMARQNRPRRELLCLDDVIRTVLEVYGYTLKASDIELRFTPSDSPLYVRGDCDQLHQVMMNLLVNAQQAMANVSRPRVLTIQTRKLESERRLEMRITDTGDGIQEQVRPRIFDPYFTTKPMGAGTGIGLSVSLATIQSHGGDIRLEQTGTHGTTFVVTLPLSCEPEEKALIAPVVLASPRESRRLLVVDDEEEVREMLRDILTIADHNVRTACSGDEALQILEKEQFDAILTDVRMPGIDGPAFLRAAVARKPLLAQRFIFMTGDGLNEQAWMLALDVPPPVIEKPFSADDVLQTIERTCGAARSA